MPVLEPRGRRRRAAIAILLAAATLVAGCGEPTNGSGGRDSGAAARQSAEVDAATLERQVLDVVSALRDDRGGGYVDGNAWADRVRATLARMDDASPQLGRARLARLEEQDDSLEDDLRARLLDAATRAMSNGAQEEIARFLALRVERFGAPMMERNQACKLLGEHCPEQAVTTLRPLLSPEERGTTLPDDEYLVAGYVAAAKAVDEDPTAVLCSVADDPRRDSYARVLALRELEGSTSPTAIATFESVMVESSGDAAIRRAAVVSYVASVPAAKAIERLEKVQEREADYNMQRFLQDAVDKLRGGG
ncbi:MAG: hypothetical protein R3F34_11945 [Planctomycetota bacterium]